MLTVDTPSDYCIVAIYSYVFVANVYTVSLQVYSATLRVLNVGGNNIGDKGMEVISEALQYNKSLNTLVVGRCGLSVKGSYRM